MASPRLRAEASAQFHSRSPCTEVPRNRNLCCSHHSNHVSCAPSCSKTPSMEHFPSDNSETVRHEFCSAYCRAQTAPHLSVPCQQHGFLYPAPISISDGTPVTGSHAHERFPSSTWFSPSRFNQNKRQEQKNPRMEPSSMSRHEGCSMQSNLVTLYSWYLLRCNGSSEGVGVAVGGFFGTAGIERFESAAIVQRLEKCILLAQDGIKVRLAGLIDDRTSVSNGFSLNLVQSFLSGFPYTWNHLLDNEFCAPSTKHQDHRVLGDCGLNAVIEMPQLSFEGCCSDQLQKAPSLSQEKDCHNHHETLNEIESNAEQKRMEAQSEERNDHLSNHIASIDNGNLETGILKDDQLIHSDTTGTLEQDILDSGHTHEKELQTNVSVDQSKCYIGRKSGRASEALLHPHVRVEESGTGDAQIGAGNTPIIHMNQSPRITRSMHKISRHAPSSKNNDNCPDGANNIINSGLFVQKSVGEDCHGHSSRILSIKKKKAKVRLSKPSDTSPCPPKEGVEISVQMEIQRSERLMNAEADGLVIQEKELVTEALPKNICDEEANEEDLSMSVQKSGVSAALECATMKNSARKDKESNKEGNISTKSTGQCIKRPNSLPPLPCPRIPVSKQLVSEAFGLKTSRSGRLLVPPLAHWCGQILLRDKDGGIIAISDGSKDMNNDRAGSFKFTPPAEASLQKLQKRLCEVASDHSPSKKKISLIKKRC